MQCSSLCKVVVLSALGGLAAWVVWAGLAPAQEAGTKGPDAAAVERTREKVRMLDDLYKGFVVQITKTYVEARESTPAATVTKRVFKHMEKNGWHTGRLIDGTGKPLNRENAPRTEFEKKAMKAILDGKPYVDEVGTRDGKAVLRAATVVPVVMKQCITCHPGHKEGDVLGALVYEVPIK